MKKQLLMFLISSPVLFFYLFMTIHVWIFVIPSFFLGSYMNSVFIILWILGGYGIYSGLVAIRSFRIKPYVLARKIQIGIVIGSVIIGALLIFTPSSEIKCFWRFFVFVSMSPPLLLLYKSMRRCR
jgi:hypothetical protein